MNVKKLALTCAISLVVIGCVMAAGCTSNQSTTPTTSAKEFIGTWVTSYDEAYAKKIQELSPDFVKKLQELGAENIADLKEETVINEDGSVTVHYLLKTGEKIGTSVKKRTWKLINETTLKVVDAEHGNFTTLTLDPATKTLKYYGESLTYTKTANA